ncbi:demethylmenaquinone methyltransferase [Salinicoccus hispanicus]|uniref:Demethylmenaquinone methyltransferase n=1 Tax=Salinicoccus hispanicus TaxID=157225 RepID=A0A6N8TXS8_9STAP|nr:demethylmenaquinone methyltransferase [Salinicoccus hispanicus]MXQ50272.1 demethylmenaquinone methyltransferase [Salinicoccus hispanicus]
MDKETKVQNIFNSISSDYDLMNDIISLNQHNMWRRRTMKEMFVKNGQSVLDVCCGTGDWTIQLSETAPDARVIGIDFSEKMLEVAEEKTVGHSNIELTQGNAMALPFDDGSFDYVTIGFGLRNLPDYKKAIDEFYRVLKPGGTLVVLETSIPENKLVNQGFDFYFGTIMPTLGGLIADRSKEYEWLYESTSAFLSKNELKSMMAESGFTNLKVIPHTFGTAATHIGYRPLERVKLS